MSELKLEYKTWRNVLKHLYSFHINRNTKIYVFVKTKECETH